VSLGKSIGQALSGKECFYCIDTAHTPLLSFLISLGYYFFKVDSILFYRIFSVIFILGTLYYLLKIAQFVYERKKDSFWIFIIILLFPGFFSFSVKVNLDIVALFFSSFVIYYILKKEAYWKIGLILLLVFLSKEYAVLFSGFVVFFMVISDGFQQKEVPLKKRITKAVIDLAMSFLPLLIAFVFFATISIFPYSRIIDNIAFDFIGPKYILWGEKISLLADHVRKAINFLDNSDSSHNFSGNLNTASSFKVNYQILPEKNTFINLSFFQKIVNIYKSGYGENDINIIAIPLIIIGLFSRLKKLLLNLKNKYDLVRKDLIMFLLLIIVLYFSYFVAAEDHGFRIIFPLIIPYTYFIYWAFKEIFDGNYWTNFTFAVISFIFIFIYFEVNKGNIFYGSLLSKNYLVSIFLKYKIFFNVLLYSFFSIFIIFYAKIKLERKKILLVILIIIIFLYKITPFAFEKFLVDKEYGRDYNLLLARSYLEEIETGDPIVLTNVRSYAYYYYANITKMPNVDRPDLPLIRKKPEIVYYNRLIRPNSLSRDKFDISFLCKKQVDYIFYLNDDNNRIFFPEEYIKKLNYLNSVYEYRYEKNDRFNWGIYAVNKKYCNNQI
jgi:hypothetical protein